MKLQLVVAMTKSGVIGNKGTLPWSIPQDMANFRKITIGKTVIMGKTTWLSLPEKFRPLPKRNNIVVSSTLGEQKGATVCKSVEDAVELAKKFGVDACCIGGAQLYASMLPIIEEMHISWIKKNYKGKTIFPEINFSEWEKRETHEFDEFTYERYARKH